MHEYPITQHIISLACSAAQKKRNSEKGAAKVTAINLCMGDNCGYLADSMALYFDLIAENTICQGAVLNIEHIEPKLRCNKCKNLFKRKPFIFDCPVNGCGGMGEPTEIGREFYIKSIEIE